jgi:hypothetical protein
VGGRLYLVKLTGTLKDGSQAGLGTVFPGFPERVFAHWYTGTLRIPRGQRLHYRHQGYDSVFERDEILEFEQGVIRRTWVRHNGEADLTRARGSPARSGLVTAQAVQYFVSLGCAGQLRAKTPVDELVARPLVDLQSARPAAQCSAASPAGNLVHPSVMP